MSRGDPLHLRFMGAAKHTVDHGLLELSALPMMFVTPQVVFFVTFAELAVQKIQTDRLLLER